MIKKVLFSATIAGHIRAFHEPYLRWFKEKGYEVHVATGGDQTIKFCDKQHKINFNRHPFSLSNYKAYLKIKRLLKIEKYEIIHCHTPTASVITRLAALNERKEKTKVFYTVHGFHFFKGASLKNWCVFFPVEKILARFTDVIITINKEDFELAKKQLARITKVEFCNGVGVDLTRFHPISVEEKILLRKELGYYMDDLLLIYPGEFSKRKNQIMLVKMLTYLKGRLNSFKLLLAGRGDYKFLEEKSEELNVRTHIDFLGFKHDIEKFIQVSDIAVSSSYHEGLPINIVEAMACGKPVVCTNVRGNNDLIVHGQNGFLVKSDDESEMAKYIFELAQQPNLYDLMSKNAIDKAQDYSLSNTIKSMDRIYRSNF